MTGAGGPKAAGAASERLAAALRENLRRRKRQRVLRAAPGKERAAVAAVTDGPASDPGPAAPGPPRRP